MFPLGLVPLNIGMGRYPNLAKDKITSEEWIKFKNRQLTSSDIYYLQISRITTTDLSIYDDMSSNSFLCGVGLS